MSKPDTKQLTPKQLHFCRCVASGMTQAAAYREAYDVQAGSLSKTQQESASRLMSKPKVAARVEALVRQRERGMMASCLSDRELVLNKLRYFMDHAETDSAKIRATELLGKSVGLFKDVVETVVQRSPAEVEAELTERLELLQAKYRKTDNAVH